jgi:signal transduction histidine kinase
LLESIGRRLTLGYVGILALILVLFGAIVVLSFERQLTRQQDKLLMQKAEAETKVFLNGGDKYGGIKAKTQSDIAVVAVPPDGDIAAEALRLGDWQSSLGLPFEGLARRAAQEKKPNSETVEDGPEGPVRVVSRPMVDGSGHVVAVIQAAQSRAIVRETVGRLIAVLAAAGLGALVLSAAGGLYMSRKAMRPAREAFARQRDFVADASHELKTPLALTKVNAEEIRRNPSSPNNREIVEDQLSEIDRMDALLSDLLTLARLDSGRLEVEKKPFNLAVVAGEGAERFLNRAAAERIRLEISLPREVPVRGDAARTGQILAALLDNAVRHTPQGGTVTVSGRALDGKAQVSVSDTGPGVPPKHLPRIFERFYRVEEARTRKGGGTGLGLAIARDLARAQGGDLTATNGSGEHRGAVFVLTLPRDR